MVQVEVKRRTELAHIPLGNVSSFLLQVIDQKGEAIEVVLGD